MCKNLSNFILPMKGVSDNNAPKKIKSKGNQSELKKPLQVLQLNKKPTINDTSKNFLDNEKSPDNTDVSTSIQSRNDELNTNSLEKEPEYKNSDQSNSIFNDLEKPTIQIEKNEEFEFERTVDDFDFDEDQFLEALNDNEPIGLTGETIGGKIIALESDGVYIDIGGKLPVICLKKNVD